METVYIDNSWNELQAQDKFQYGTLAYTSPFWALITTKHCIVP